MSLYKELFGRKEEAWSLTWEALCHAEIQTRRLHLSGGSTLTVSYVDVEGGYGMRKYKDVDGTVTAEVWPHDIEAEEVLERDETLVWRRKCRTDLDMSTAKAFAQRFNEKDTVRNVSISKSEL